MHPITDVTTFNTP